MSEVLFKQKIQPAAGWLLGIVLGLIANAAMFSLHWPSVSIFELQWDDFNAVHGNSLFYLILYGIAGVCCVALMMTWAWAYYDTRYLVLTTEELILPRAFGPSVKIKMSKVSLISHLEYKGHRVGFIVYGIGNQNIPISRSMFTTTRRYDELLKCIERLSGRRLLNFN